LDVLTTPFHINPTELKRPQQEAKRPNRFGNRELKERQRIALPAALQRQITSQAARSDFERNSLREVNDD
jgi:hypothetical protein